MITRKKILAVVEERYDHYSARVVLTEAIAKAGVPDDKKSFEPREVQSISESLAAIGERMEDVTAALNEMAGSKPDKAKEEPPKKEAPKKAAGGKKK